MLYHINFLSDIHPMVTISSQRSTTSTYNFLKQMVRFLMFNSLILNKLDIMQQNWMKPSKGSFKDILICEYEQQPKISEFSSPLHTPLLNYKHAFRCSHFLILNCTASMFAFFLKYFWFLSSFLLRWLGNKCLLTPFLFTLYVRKCITYIAIFKLVTKSTLWLITYLVSSNHFTMNS